MEKLKIFKMRYLKPTATRGARISITSVSKGYREIIDYDYENSILNTTIKHIEESGYKVIGVDQSKNYYYIATERKY